MEKIKWFNFHFFENHSSCKPNWVCVNKNHIISDTPIAHYHCKSNCDTLHLTEEEANKCEENYENYLEVRIAA